MANMQRAAAFCHNVFNTTVATTTTTSASFIPTTIPPHSAFPRRRRLRTGTLITPTLLPHPCSRVSHQRTCTTTVCVLDDMSTPSTSGAERDLPLVTTSRDRDVPTPGESCHLYLPYDALKRLQEHRQRDFVFVPSSWLYNGHTIDDDHDDNHDESEDERNTKKIHVGFLLNVLRIIRMTDNNEDDDTNYNKRDDDSNNNDKQLLLKVECRCHCRVKFSIDSSSKQPKSPATNNNGTSPSVSCTTLHDTIPLDSHDVRKRLASLEWEVWLNMLENGRLRRRLYTKDVNATERELRECYEASVRAWAPKHYDRGVTVDEWKVTPTSIKETWYRRAQSFSFAVMRCVGACDHENEREFQRSLATNSTEERLIIAMKCLEEESRKLMAMISLKQTIG